MERDTGKDFCERVKSIVCGAIRVKEQRRKNQKHSHSLLEKAVEIV
jgi:hypothetical protein